MATLEAIIGTEAGAVAIKKLDRNIKSVNLELESMGGTDVSASLTNGNIKVDDSELQVYRIANDLINTLDSTNANKALAAPQGKALAEQISILTTKQENTLEPLVIEDFTDISNFEFLDKNGTVLGNWTIADNKISSVIGATSNSIAWRKKVKLNDGYIQLTYDNPSTTGSHYVGIAFRRKNKNNFMIALLWDGAPGKVDLWKCVNDAFTLITSVSFSTLDVINANNIPKTLEVEIIGNTAKIFVNNKLMITSTNSAIADNMYGECGILSYNTKVSTFSSFVVSKKRFDILNSNITKVLCSGTSITYGVGATTPYPTLLKDKLQDGFCTKPLTVINGGHSGKNTTDILAYLITEISTHSPNVVILEGNINDTSLTVGMTTEQSIANTRKMIKLCKQNNIIPILTTSTHTNPSLNTANWNKTSFDKQVINNILLRKLALEEDIILVDIAKAFSNDFTLLGDDIHPNDVGTELIAQTIYNTFIQ